MKYMRYVVSGDNSSSFMIFLAQRNAFHCGWAQPYCVVAFAENEVCRGGFAVAFVMVEIFKRGKLYGGWAVPS